MKKQIPTLASQTKFLTSSVVATGVDYTLFLLLDWLWLAPVAAHTLSYPIAVLCNFYLQKRFIFDLNRPLKTAFGMSMLFSAIGWGLGVALMAGLIRLGVQPILAKVLTTVLLFFFNFYTKRFAFEGAKHP